MDISASLEDYLEVIFELQGEGMNAVRVRDIASKKSVKMPSVTAALIKLKNLGMVDYNRYDYLTLTDKGMTRAANLARRHHVLRKFFNELLGVELQIADRDACIVEHELSRETIDAMKKFCTRVDCGEIKL
ncbi:MAG: metal-dependent transcriptional regulator [Pseudomonadota bacterium]